MLMARSGHTSVRSLAKYARVRRSRVLTVGRMIDDIIEWGWREAPARRLIFA